MITQESVLKFKEFSILRSHCEFTPFRQTPKNCKCSDIMDKYPVDINFDVKYDEDNNIYMILVSVKINPEKNEGYSIYADGCGIFEIEADEDTRIIYQSGVNICITNIRAYIASLTSYYPMGKFNFHSIDMNAFFKAKEEIDTQDTD